MGLAGGAWRRALLGNMAAHVVEDVLRALTWRAGVELCRSAPTGRRRSRSARRLGSQGPRDTAAGFSNLGPSTTQKAGLRAFRWGELFKKAVRDAAVHGTPVATDEAEELAPSAVTTFWS